MFFVDFDMKQAEIVMISKGENYDASKLPQITLYNNYFGGGMSSVVFQDLRESKALAYSAYSTYLKPNTPKRRYVNYSYIGSQADKLAEALKGMSDLLNEMPKADVSFNSAKEVVLQEIRSERITKSGILFNYEEAVKFGNKTDVRKEIFEKVSTMNFDEMAKFQESIIKNKPVTVLVV
ncbi:MAG TPA: insulinase family protein, partial [Bacteroidia bacterium]|nr:insulinase family protein [Bacteroidia bacterium]